VSSPVIDDQGMIYFCSNDGKLYCVDNDGNEQWNYSTEGIVWMTPALNHEGEIVFGSMDGVLYCVHPNGTLKWSSEVGEQLGGTISIDSEGNIYCIDKIQDLLLSTDAEGNIRWSYPIAWGDRGVSIGMDGTIYFGVGYNLVALDTNGSLKWRFEIGECVFGPPAIGSDGTIFFGSTDGNLYALDQSGNEKWRFEGGENAWIWASPAIGSDGTVYIGNQHSQLFAINGIPDASLTLITGAAFALIMGVILAIWAAYPKKGN